MIPIDWKESEQQLTIGARKGSYPTMPKERKFQVIFVRENHGAGEEGPADIDRTIDYNGDAETITLQRRQVARTAI